MNLPQYESGTNEAANSAVEAAHSRTAMPEVTVVIPVYRGGLLVRETIDSLLKQTYRNLHVLVICDGSPDPLDHQLGQIYGGQIEFVAQQNIGLCNSLNRAIFELVKTPLMARCDQDDLSRATRISEQVGAMLTSGADACLTRIGKFVRPGQILASHPESTDAIFNYDPAIHGAIVHSTLLANTSFLRALGGYRQEFYPCDDFDLNLRMHRTGNVVVVGQVLVEYRIHEDAHTFQYYWEMQAKTRYLLWLDQHRDSPVGYEEWLGVNQKRGVASLSEKRQELGRLYYRRSGVRLGSGRWLSGCWMLFGALLLAPSFSIQRLRIALQTTSLGKA